MNKNTITAEDLHKGLGKVIRDAANHDAYTVVTRHGIATVAVVPVNGIYGWALTRALREAEKMEDEEA